MDGTLARHYPGRAQLPVSIGRSGDRVLRLEANGQAPLIAKIAAPTRIAALRGEVARLDWLASKRLPTPEVVAVFEAPEALTLVMTCLPGADLVVSDATPAVKVDQLAAALATLHALNPTDCPFDESAPVRLERARRTSGSADVAHADRSAPDLFAELFANLPRAEDLVVAHGDPCLPNLLLDGDRFAGFVDCGHVGRADRWLDLELAAGSIRYNLGDACVGRFFAAYGLDAIDAERMAWHRRLEDLS